MSNEAIQKLFGLAKQGQGIAPQNSEDSASASDLKNIRKKIQSSRDKIMRNPLAEQEAVLAQLVKALEGILGNKAPLGMKNGEKLQWLKNEISTKSAYQKTDILIKLEMHSESSIGIGKHIKNGIKKETIGAIQDDMKSASFDASQRDALKSRMKFLGLDNGSQDRLSSKNIQA